MLAGKAEGVRPLLMSMRSLPVCFTVLLGERDNTYVWTGMNMIGSRVVDCCRRRMRSINWLGLCRGGFVALTVSVPVTISTFWR